MQLFKKMSHRKALKEASMKICDWNFPYHFNKPGSGIENYIFPLF